MELNYSISKHSLAAVGQFNFQNSIVSLVVVAFLYFGFILFFFFNDLRQKIV